MRRITLTLSCLMAGTLATQAEVLLNVEKHNPVLVEMGLPVTIDLTNHFQLFPNPGPVASFSLHMPAQTGFQDLLYRKTYDGQPDYNPDGPTIESMTYELAGGGTYNHLFDPVAHPQNYVWNDYTVNFQLLADVAPVTVGNFIQYVSDDEFDKTIVHRSENVENSGIGIVQLGRYRISDADEYLLTEIEKRATIAFEETIDNVQGTLAMARMDSPNSASSEFYINLADNTNTLAKNYSVFGELVDFTTDMPILNQMGEAFVWNLQDFAGSVFRTTPLYSPYYLEKGSWVNIQDITIAEGTTSGITYGYEFGDLDGEEGTSEDEAAFQAAFDVTIDGTQMVINRNNSGYALVVVKGIFGDQEQSFTIPVTGYNPEALNAFPFSTVEADGFLNDSWYGRMNAEAYPQVFHKNHGEQAVYYTEDEETFDREYYIYDIGLISWLYTTPELYPFIYVYRTGKWMGYVKGTGNADDEPRYFWDFHQEKWVYTNRPGSTVGLP